MTTTLVDPVAAAIPSYVSTIDDLDRFAAYVRGMGAALAERIVRGCPDGMDPARFVTNLGVAADLVDQLLAETRAYGIHQPADVDDIDWRAGWDAAHTLNP